MIVVTGGMGFIGSRLVHRLNQQGYTDILVVDDLSDGHKFRNLRTAQISDYLDKDDFLEQVLCHSSRLPPIHVVFHQGACSTTTQWDGQLMMAQNYQYSKHLLHYCQQKNIPFIYASSAATYGNRSTNFTENCTDESPLNIYGYSKLLFDRYVSRHVQQTQSQIVGLRYFNVYGPGEQHKQSMASVAYHVTMQLHQEQSLKLFAASHGYGDGEHCRDFVYVDDVCDVNIWFWKHPEKRGIFNCGSGVARSFLHLAQAVIAFHQRGHIEFIPMPSKLEKSYQSYTQADLSCLRNAGYTQAFTTLEEGVARYMQWLEDHCM